MNFTLILEIAAGVAIGLLIFDWLRPKPDPELEEKDREWNRLRSAENPPQPPNKYTGHPHGCMCKLCVSSADIDHEERKAILAAKNTTENQ